MGTGTGLKMMIKKKKKKKIKDMDDDGVGRLTVGGEDERMGWWHLPSSDPAATIPYNAYNTVQCHYTIQYHPIPYLPYHIIPYHTISYNVYHILYHVLYGLSLCSHNIPYILY